MFVDLSEFFMWLWIKQWKVKQTSRLELFLFFFLVDDSFRLRFFCCFKKNNIPKPQSFFFVSLTKYTRSRVHYCDPKALLLRLSWRLMEIIKNEYFLVCKFGIAQSINFAKKKFNFSLFIITNAKEKSILIHFIVSHTTQ